MINVISWSVNVVDGTSQRDVCVQESDENTN